MNLKFDWQLYALIFVAVIAIYLIINQVLVYRIKKIVPAEVLKNRE
jgi:putative ABC transport system permease protein